MCDGQDNDCNGSTWAAGGEADADSDGSLACADCNDTQSWNWPGGTEVCDGYDNNCASGANYTGAGGNESDADGDGYLACSTTFANRSNGDTILGNADCNDADSQTYPGGSENTEALCTDGSDNDCDGYTDGLDPDCPTTGDDDDSTAATDLVFVALPSGSFDMGCTAGQSSCGSDESPAHTVTLTHGFWLSETEVTQGQWETLMSNNPSYFGPNGGGTDCGLDCPVETVNWYEGLALANALSIAEGLPECYSLSGCNANTPGNDMECSTVGVTSASGSVYDCEGYRLPTEAEWEYSARAGTDLLYSGSDIVGDVAWYSSNSGSSTHPVATKDPNAWGLYDLSGNVWEWTWDRYGSSYYSTGSPWTDPEGPSTGANRVRRGGGWNYTAAFARVAYRYNGGPPGSRYVNIGLRLARTIP